MCKKRQVSNLAIFRTQRIRHLQRVALGASLPLIISASLRAKFAQAHEAAREKKILLLKEKAKEAKERDLEKLAEWRRGIAMAVGLKNPDFKGKVPRSPEDRIKDVEGFSFTYADQKDTKRHW